MRAVLLSKEASCSPMECFYWDVGHFTSVTKRHLLGLDWETKEVELYIWGIVHMSNNTKCNSWMGAQQWPSDLLSLASQWIHTNSIMPTQNPGMQASCPFTTLIMHFTQVRHHDCFLYSTPRDLYDFLCPLYSQGIWFSIQDVSLKYIHSDLPCVLTGPSMEAERFEDMRYLLHSTEQLQSMMSKYLLKVTRETESVFRVRIWGIKSTSLILMNSSCGIMDFTVQMIIERQSSDKSDTP